MKKYIKANSEDKKYIGGKLYDLPDSYWEDDEQMEARAEEQDAYVYDFNPDGHYIIYRPDSARFKFTLYGDSNILYEVTDSMRIKDGVDVVAYNDHIDVIGYYSGAEDIVKLYPIREDIADKLGQLIDNADFSESTVIENEIAQVAWGGTSVEDVLCSWR